MTGSAQAGSLIVNPAERKPGTWGRFLRGVLGLELIVLLALVQVLYAGYRLGVGNQSIQIPFLRHAVDPQLYANDPMVRQTLGDYHSFFFRILAAVVGRTDVASAYFWLHVATAAAVLAVAYGLGRAMFRSRATGAVLVLLMLAGHHRCLAGDDLYSVGFTHTWAVFPLALFAILLLYRDLPWAAFAVVGLIFNLHALTAGYLLAMFLAWAAVDYRVPGWKWKLPLMLVLFAALAYPTVAEMARDHQQFGADWLEKTRIRSADHSFPSTWWSTGDGAIPRYALLVGLAAVALSFSAERRNQRKSLLLAAGVGVLFLVGWLLSDVHPVATVVRAQLFRSSRLLAVLLLAHVAHGIASGWGMIGIPRFWRRREPHGFWMGSSDQPAPGDVQPQPVIPVTDQPVYPGRVAEFILAIATFLCVAVPGLFALAPWLLLATVLVALANGRLSWGQATVASLALLVTAIAWRTIEFHIPGIDGEVSLKLTLKQWVDGGKWLWIVAGVAVFVWVVVRVPVGPRARACAAVALVFACTLFGLHAHRALAQGTAGATDDFKHWVEIQDWAALNTPKDALFLTPPGKDRGGFRIRSGRSVVWEWRDGTQLYFSADFAKDWWNKLTTLRPALYDAKSHRELLSSRTLERMSDQEIIQVAKEYGATHVVLPANPQRDLDARYSNGVWTVYEPVILDSQDAFIKHVAQPNIEKYRKSDVKLTLADTAGGTLADATVEIRQVRQAFGFGVSIPFFQEPVGDEGPDFEPPPVTPRQLERVKGVFNYSVIPFSAKWQRLEPAEGERHYEELDKYVDWCVKNGITMEFHYLSGFTPRWVAYKSVAEQREAWLRHCRATVDRYHDRIKYWQVMNDARLERWAGEAFKEIRQKYPDLKLGISNCAYFYSAYTGPSARAELLVGSRELEDLQAEGVKVDFFSTHGHKPMGRWPDMRQVYESLDEWAKYGVKVHVSEATLDVGLPFVSNVKQADAWTPELAANFFEQYYTTLFSHPDVEAINYWDLGPSLIRGFVGGGRSLGGTGQAGLLDPNNNDEPRPVYNRLKKLITETWMTRLTTQAKADGAVSFRGFHGDYEVVATLPGGKTLKGRFSVHPGEGNTYQLRLAETSNSLATGR